MYLALPAVLVGFMIAGYFFAGWTIRPIEEAFARLKRFLADAGHELKTPLTIAQTHSEALEQELLDRSVTNNRVDVIRTALARMQRLVEDLVLLTQTEAPQFLHPSNDVSVDQIILAVAEDFQEKCKAKEIQLSCDVSPQITMRCDPECLRRAVSNLTENAWRYTEPGGNIVLSASSHPKQVRIAVEDSGIGIPAEALPHLFDRFYRVEGSRSRKEGGSGLGLAIVKGIVEAHGGKVSVQSSTGCGTKFTVTLPTG
jgi:signal transduction histidine kinase